MSLFLFLSFFKYCFFSFLSIIIVYCNIHFLWLLHVSPFVGLIKECQFACHCKLPWFVSGWVSNHKTSPCPWTYLPESRHIDLYQQWRLFINEHSNFLDPTWHHQTLLLPRCRSWSTGRLLADTEGRHFTASLCKMTNESGKRISRLFINTFILTRLVQICIIKNKCRGLLRLGTGTRSEALCSVWVDFNIRLVIMLRNPQQLLRFFFSFNITVK